MADLVRVGSETAKGGFANEKNIARKFDSWRTDKEAQKWLMIMGYNLKEIKEVEAIILHGFKTDVQIKVLIKLKKAIAVENLSVKKANKEADYNQTDKRWVRTYKEMWNVPDKLANLLRMFSGEISPSELLKQGKIRKEKYNSLKDKRRFFLNELNKKDVGELLNFFKNNKTLIISDIIKGGGGFAAGWMLVTRYIQEEDKTSWVLMDINKAMNIFSQGDVKISPQNSLYIGRITMQRKGGDGGRPTANMLQFKIRPCDLFSY